MNKILCGDAFTVLKTLPDNSINCCITSPPYFGMRDYGCLNQIGQEPTPEKYISRLTEVFHEVKRIITPDGVCWINIADTYAGSNKKHWNNIKPKDLCGIPWLLAFSLRADGWFLRSSIIWNKPNPMPESVKDRPSVSYEYIFLLTKSSKYYYDYKAIQEPVTDSTVARMKRGYSNKHRYIEGAPGQKYHNINKPRDNKVGDEIILPTMRNKRNIWTVPTNSCREAHFATFPEELIKPCVLAGCPPKGTIIDPFIGSGTTAIVALSEGRNYLGIDINLEYCDISKQRIAKHVSLL